MPVTERMKLLIVSLDTRAYSPGKRESPQFLLDVAIPMSLLSMTRPPPKSPIHLSKTPAPAQIMLSFINN